jgi:hypothetical protein
MIDATAMTASPLDVAGWAELGREIARTMAAAWCAEWRGHCWDDVSEKEPFRSRYERIEGLEYDDRHVLIDACHDAWRRELAGLLRAKRGSRRLDEVWTANDFNPRPVHLQLDDHSTITGSVSADGSQFTFRLSYRAEKTIALTGDEEFAVEPMEKKLNLRTDRLVLTHESSGYRHYLGRRDVHCGRGLTLVLPDNTRIAGRYECNLHRDDCEPVFYFSLAGGIDGVQRCLRMPSDAEYLLEERS